jgi:hypothetical protein
VAQLALTMVLLAGAGFMTRSFLKMNGMEVGIDTSRLIVMQMILGATKYPTLEDRAAFLDASTSSSRPWKLSTPHPRRRVLHLRARGA